MHVQVSFLLYSQRKDRPIQIKSFVGKDKKCENRNYPMTAVIPIRVQRKQSRFDLYDDLVQSLKEHTLETGDIIVISSKYVANSENRFVDLKKTRPSSDAEELTKKYQVESKISEVILRESDTIFGGIAGFVLTSADNVLAPNAGIDKSNAKKGTVILYPDNPYQIAEQLRRKIFLNFGVSVGIIIVDSRLMPTRIGTSGVAIACARLEPVQARSEQKELDGS